VAHMMECYCKSGQNVDATHQEYGWSMYTVYGVFGLYKIQNPLYTV
jgi:hypothetical protein